MYTVIDYNLGCTLTPPKTSMSSDSSDEQHTMFIDKTNYQQQGCLHSPVTQPSCRELKSPQKDMGQAFSGYVNIWDNSHFLEPLQALLIKHGHASHMGFQDPSYKVFFSEAKDAAFIYKILDRTAVISGDPLCPTELYVPLLRDFRQFCKRSGHKVAVVGASDAFARVVQREAKSCITMQFGLEKVINPVTNPLLTGKSGKRTVQKSRQLLKKGLTVETYLPGLQHDFDIEDKVAQIYNDWRACRNDNRTCQAFVTVFDLFFLPDIMAYFILRNPQKEIIGFAALRSFENESHLDPVIASPHAPSGATDVLMITAFTFARDAGYKHLSLGFEPLQELKDITGVPGFLATGIHAVHRRILSRLPLGGKQAFYQRFHPDAEQDGALHIIFFQQPTLRSALAILHFANVDIRSVVKSGSANLGKRVVAGGKRRFDGSYSEKKLLPKFRALHDNLDAYCHAL
jgi:hypothetical protein